MIIIENEYTPVRIVHGTVDATVPRAQVAIGSVGGQLALVSLLALAVPRAILAMRRNDHPFPAQRVPALLPGHVRQLTAVGMREQRRAQRDRTGVTLPASKRDANPQPSETKSRSAGARPLLRSRQLVRPQLVV